MISKNFYPYVAVKPGLVEKTRPSTIELFLCNLQGNLLKTNYALSNFKYKNYKSENYVHNYR